jgi:hypothetical protein
MIIQLKICSRFVKNVVWMFKGVFLNPSREKWLSNICRKGERKKMVYRRSRVITFLAVFILTNIQNEKKTKIK